MDTTRGPRQVAAADCFVEHGAWVSLLALAETTWVLATVYERNATEIATAVALLLNHRDVILQDPTSSRRPLISSESGATELNVFSRRDPCCRWRRAAAAWWWNWFRVAKRRPVLRPCPSLE